MPELSCQIIRNPYTNAIDRVEATNGEESLLYQEALRQVSDPEEALNIWTVNYLDDFQETVLPEPTITERKSDKEGFWEVSNEGSKITYKRRGNNIDLELIETPLEYRGRGNARRLLQDFVYQADQDRATINLMVNPRDNATQQGALESFYSSEGFEFATVNGVQSDFEMVRYPQRTAPITDRNGEARLGVVMKYINSVTEVEPLTSQEEQDVENMLIASNLFSSQQFQKALDRIFPQGVFSAQALQSSNIFTQPEKAFIQDNVEAQGNLKELLQKLNNKEEVIYNDADFNENFVIYTGERNKYGKDLVENPFVIDKNIAEVVAGIEDVEAFDNAFNSIPYESLVEEYNENEDFAEEMYAKYSQLKKVPLQRLENGETTNKQTTSRTKTVENTINLENSDFASDIQFLAQIPQDVWETSDQEITQALSQIERKGRNAAIDLEGIQDRPRNEIIAFLATLNNLENNQSQENLDAFLDAYTEFFGVETQEATSIEDLPPHHRNKTLVRVENPTSEYEMFENHSLVKVDNGLYQQVNKMSLPNMYESIYAQAVVRDNRILPNEAYFGSSETDNARLAAPENKEEVLNNIQYFIENNISQLNLGVDNFDTKVAQQLLLFKYYFNNPLDTVVEDYSYDDMQSLEEFTGDSEYLSSDYISDFQVAKLKERNKESELYDNVYSQFEIDERGIYPINDDVISVENLRKNIESMLSEKQYEDLKNYSVVSKNRTIKSLFPNEAKPNIRLLQQERNYYRNNLEALPLFKGNYTNVDVGAVATTETGDSFIRINNRLFEKAQDNGGMSFYREIPVNNSDFNIITEESPVNKFAQEVINPYIRTTETQERINNKYSQEELEEINQNQFDCE